MPAPRSELCSRYLHIFVVVSCYWLVSIATVFVNKTLLSSQSVALDAPLFITWFQCVVSYTICSVLNRTGGVPRVFTFPKGSPWCIDVIRKVIKKKSYPYIGPTSGPIEQCYGSLENNFLTPEGFCSLMALIGTNGQGIGTSPLAMWVNAVLDLTMSDDERQQLDLFIDKLYEYVEGGKK